LQARRLGARGDPTRRASFKRLAARPAAASQRAKRPPVFAPGRLAGPHVALADLVVAGRLNFMSPSRDGETISAGSPSLRAQPAR
jgi:hypothetical protein